MNLMDSLKENNSVVLKRHASTWEEAIEACMKPLVEKNAVERSYVDAIIGTILRACSRACNAS